MNAATAEVATQRTSGASWLWRRQLAHYPDTLPRTGYLAITVLATITLYYELYVGGSVSTLILANLHMSFTFFAVMTGLGSLIGAFGSLLAGPRRPVRPGQPGRVRAAVRRPVRGDS